MTRVLVVLLASLPGVAWGVTPSMDRIDYGAPKSCLEIPASLGDREAIQKQADLLKGRSDRDTVRKVLSWMESHLKYDAKMAYQWRNFDDAVREKCYGGCADQGLVCGALLRAAGIPTVWVKTMDVPWIWDLKKGREFTSWSGHVFLEIYLDHEWVLLDPGAKLIYRDYSPKMRILPGNRFAYDKGSDPKQMIMSLQREERKEQTHAYFTALDPALLPVDPQSPMQLPPQVFIVGNDPYYKILAEMARSKGWSVRQSFNTGYDKALPLAKGHVLLVETHNHVPIVALEQLEKYFPKASDGLKAASGVVEVDGTTIMFVDFADLLNAIEEAGEAKVK